MALPFLSKPKKQSSGMTNVIKASESSGMEPQEAQNAPLLACAQDLINAIHSRNEQGVADALSSLMECYQPQEQSEEDQSE